ncbi:protein HUA2-LIKE 1-like [Cynara cardunculus var. scolymus]|uniref:protein HUA2-LIKE 1-like n=1 Tax=Cynara cardunculus var. scolymus TaxID=59895 RepID=UPI000D631480|nr:protein HUA2-LIKE 1-like [Cynara cardunculus var. scolymus]
MDQTSPKSPPPQQPPPPPPPLNSLVPATVAPTPLIVPKAFKYPEMYMSPTDLIMSPVTKGILARTRSNKSSHPLQPSSTSKEQHKIQVSKFEEMGTLEI